MATPRSGSQQATSAAAAAPASLWAKKNRWLVPAAIVAVATAGAVAWRFTTRETTTSATPSPPGEMTMQRLSGLGDVNSPALSDDGKILAYVTADRGRRSISLRQMATGSTVRITESTDQFIENLQFTPDGNFLYYSVRGSSRPFRWALMTIPVFGGTPRQVVDAELGRVTFSPDGNNSPLCRRSIKIRS